LAILFLDWLNREILLSIKGKKWNSEFTIADHKNVFVRWHWFYEPHIFGNSEISTIFFEDLKEQNTHTHFFTRPPASDTHPWHSSFFPAPLGTCGLLSFCRERHDPSRFLKSWLFGRSLFSGLTGMSHSLSTFLSRAFVYALNIYLSLKLDDLYFMFCRPLFDLLL